MADDSVRHSPGTPCWVVLVTPDAGRTGPFYAALFGWSAPPADSGFASVTCDGRDVAAVLPMPPEAAEVGAASRWLIYLATDDIGGSLARARPAGGEILAPAFDVGDLGSGWFNRWYPGVDGQRDSGHSAVQWRHERWR